MRQYKRRLQVASCKLQVKSKSCNLHLASCILRHEAYNFKLPAVRLSADNPDANQPITITSNNMEARKKENLVIFRGDVVAQQKDYTLYSRELHVYYADGQEIKEMIATGDVRIVQSDKVATGEKAVYTKVNRAVVLTGNPQVEQDCDVVKGEKIIIYLDEDKSVVAGVNLAVNRGEIVGLLGPNGAGKTTIFYMVVGLIGPEDGRISLGEEDITQLPMYKRARKGISYLPQEASVFRKLTVGENIRAVLEFLDLPKDEEDKRQKGLLHELGIAHLENSKAYSLSGGERRRVEIARSLVNSPSFILLDEPFAGIDPIAVADIQDIIVKLKSKGIGVLLTDHNWRETLGICDRAYIIDEGEIIEEGTPDEIMESKKAREVYLGERFSSELGVRSSE